MPNHGTYASLTDIRTTLGYSASDTADDSRLLAVLEAVSRFADDHCERHFYVKTQTRTLTAEHSNKLLLDDDLLSITSLKTDEDDDWDYDYTWATTDYHLYPFNEFPKYKLMTKSGGRYSFPSQVEGVQIVGPWGYGNGESATPYDDSGTTTNEVLDTTETGVDLVSGSAVQVGQTILVESEQMYITSISTNTATVVRGVNGTTAAIHTTGQTVYIYRYPKTVREACLLQASRLFRRKDAPFGVTGSAESGTTMVIARLDPDVRFLLAPLRRLTAE